jgi:hypothetical protein
LECCSLVDSTLPTFTSAFKSFKGGATAATLYKALAKVLKFKIALEVASFSQPVAVSANSFKVPAPVKIIGKRTEP